MIAFLFLAIIADPSSRDLGDVSRTATVATATVVSPEERIERAVVDLAAAYTAELARVEGVLRGEQYASVVWTIVGAGVGATAGAIGGARLPGELHGTAGSGLVGCLGAVVGGLAGALFGDDALWILDVIADVFFAGQ